MSKPQARLSALALAAALAIGFTTPDAHALALGRVTVQSALGEPLRVQIDVPEINAEEVSSLRVNVAAPDAFRAAGVEYNSALSSAQITLQRRPDGRYFLQLVSDRAINDPFVDLILETTWASGRIVRDYTMLFDPPSLRQPPAPMVAQVTPPPVAAPAPSSQQQQASPQRAAPEAPAARGGAAPGRAARAPAPAAAPAPAPAARAPAAPAPAGGDGKQVTVQAGDTAGKIAAANKPASISLDQMLLALLRANPDAFAGGNVNRLRSGAVLNLPSAEQAGEVPAAEARQQLVVQSRDFNEFRRRLAEGLPVTNMGSANRASGGKVQAQVEEKKPTAGTPDKLQLSKGAVQGKAREDKIARERAAKEQSERVAELNKNLSDLSKLNSAGGGGAGAGTGTGGAKPGVPVPVAGAASGPKASTPAVAAGPASAAKPAAATAATSTPSAAKPASAPAAGSATSTPITAAASAAKPASAPAAAASSASPMATVATAPASSPMAGTGAGPAAAAASAPAMAAAEAASSAAAAASAPTAAASAPGAPASAAVAAATPPKKAAPPAPPPPEPSFFDDLVDNPLIPAAGVGLLALLLGAGFYKLRQRRKATQIDSSFLESRLQPDSFFGASGGQRIDTAESNSTSATGSSMVYSPSQLDAAGDVDPVAEADVYLAYGRDLQAEEILKEALRTNPQRVAIHAKLLEIYAKRRDAKGFHGVAIEAYNLTGGQGLEWEHVCELGRELDPGNPLYRPGGEPDDSGVRTGAFAAGGAALGAAAAVAASDAVKTPHFGSTSPVELPPHVEAQPSQPPDIDLGDLDFSLDEQPSASAPTAVRSLEATQPYTPTPAPDLDFNAASEPLPQVSFQDSGLRSELPDLALDDNGLDFDIEPPAPAAAAPAAKQSDAGMMEFDLGALSLDLPSSASAEPKQQPSAEAARAAADESISTGGLELDAGDDSPLATKLALAEEFNAIGDPDGARSLAQEVLAEASGELRTRAQRLLAEIG